MSGSALSPGMFAETINFNLRLKLEKYEDCVDWIYKLLFNTYFTVDRLKVAINKLLSYIADYKREGDQICLALYKEINFTNSSTLFTSSFLQQEPFLNHILIIQFLIFELKINIT